MHRRDFIKGAARTGVASITALSASRIRGANARLRVALIGCGGRGLLVARDIQAVDGVEYIATCDVWDTHARKAKKALGGTAKTLRDFRRVLEMKDVDAVHIGTPDHWHAIPAVMALDAGKHVYCEKPVSHNVNEGKAIARAGEAHPDLVFLTGTQHRSSRHIAKAAEIIRSNQLQDVHYVKVWNFYNMMPNGIGSPPDSEPPPDLDWDFYLGPAPMVPFNTKRFIDSYKHFVDYAGGWITDFGVHRFDSVHQIMGADKPVSAVATGGRFVMGGISEHPDVLQATYEYPGWVLTYETLNTNGFGSMGRLTPGLLHHSTLGKEDRPNGMAFFGSNGTMIVDRRGLEVISEEIPDHRITGASNVKPKGPKLERIAEDEDEPTTLHAQHFVRCVRDGEKPRCDALVGHRAATVAHLGNVSYRAGRKIRWDPETEEIPGDKEAAAMLGRKARKPWDMI